jgi:transcriptional regulator with XRE-family HTH domain
LTHGEEARDRKTHEAERRREAARYGKAIRPLRERHGLSQKEIPGLSDRQVRRREDGNTVPHSSSQKKLAAAHGMGVNAYLSELAQLSARRSKPRAG